MDSITWKCKAWMLYFKKFDNFHLIHLIVRKLDVFDFIQFFAIVITNCYHIHVQDLNTFFKKHTSK